MLCGLCDMIYPLVVSNVKFKFSLPITIILSLTTSPLLLPFPYFKFLKAFKEIANS